MASTIEAPDSISEVSLHASALESRAPSASNSVSPLTVVDAPEERKEVFESYPDGGVVGWTQIVACFLLYFTTIGATYTWGVYQEELVRQGLASASTLAFIGSCQTVMQGAAAIPTSRLVARFGSRNIALVGTLLAGLGPIIAGSCVHSVAGLILAEGIIFGTGQCFVFHAAVQLPAAYFLQKRGLVTGIVYSGGGAGGAVLAIISAKLIQTIGLAWTFRVMGLIFTVVNIPCALLLKSRLPKQPFRPAGPVVDWALFKNPQFLLILTSSALAVFPLFVPPYFLPLYAVTIGQSAGTAAWLLSAFNLASAFGRIGFGYVADRFVGPVNSLIICLISISITTMLIWPLSLTLAPLQVLSRGMPCVLSDFQNILTLFFLISQQLCRTIYAVMGGICCGGFFSLQPGCIAAFFGPKRLGLIFPTMITSWSGGYFFGAPLGATILVASGGSEAGPRAFRSAFFYAGGISMLSAILLVTARWLETKRLWGRF
ncbi:MFS general substrate transporter [Meredithblackwellia eburnea MCA 4105]